MSREDPRAGAVMATKTKLKAVPEEALKRFKRCAEHEEEQRKAILSAKNFRVGNQWPDEVRLQRQGAPAIQGLAPQPARPCLTVDRISQPVRQVSNGVRQSNFLIEALPAGNGATKETARIFKGWMRRLQNDARDDAPIEWAADQAAEGGIGWFRLMTFETDLDPQHPFDQDLRIERVTNNLSVYCDETAVKPTRADARYLFVTENVPRDEFTDLHPNANATTLDEFRATGDGDGWVTEDSVRVAEYWRVEWDETRQVELHDGTLLEGQAIGEATSGDGPTDIKRERTKRTRKVMFSKITATETLFETPWLGTHIPYIPILGEELNVDGKIVVRGVIAPAMDAQRMVNYTYSAAIEAIALAPKAPFLYAAGQIDRYKRIWASANTANYFGLPYDPITIQGQPVPPPQRSTAEAPIQAMVQLMIQSEEGVKATTGIFDPSLGNLTTKDRSGTALQALQGASQFGQSNYQDNVTRALVYAGELMVELGPKILDRPGRVLQILQDGDEPANVMLGQPFTQAPDSGMPQPVLGPNQQPVTDPQQAQLFAAGLAKFYDLAAGKYGVVVNVGRNSITKRQESNRALGDLIPHLPEQMAAVLTPEYIETLDFDEADTAAAAARRALPPNLQAPPDQALSPAVQAQLAQLTTQTQQLNAALSGAKQIIDTDQIKAQRDLQKMKLEKTADMLRDHVNNAAKILIARIQASKDASFAGGQEEALSTGITQAHEAYQAALNRNHDFLLAEQGHRHTLEQNAQDHAHTMDELAASPPPPLSNGNGADAGNGADTGVSA
jgi:hypothetical protein